jgi:hypothetical protein
VHDPPPNSRAAHRPPRLAPRGGGWPARRRGEVDPGRWGSSVEEGEEGEEETGHDGRGAYLQEGAENICTFAPSFDDERIDSSF